MRATIAVVSIVAALVCARCAQADTTHQLYLSIDSQYSQWGPLSDSYSYSGYTHGTPGGPDGQGQWMGPHSGRTSGTVDYGRMSVDVKSWASGGFYYWGSAGQYMGCAYTNNSVGGYWTDTITINAIDPALNGTHGTFTAKIGIQGTRSTSYTASTNCYYRLSTNHLTQMWNGDISDGQAFNSLATSSAFDFVFGTPFTVKFDATAYSSASGATGSGSSEGHYAFAWLGFDNVFDASSNAVTAYSTTSSTGNNWSSPVPEPSSLALLAGLAGLVGVIRRKA